MAKDQSAAANARRQAQIMDDGLRDLLRVAVAPGPSGATARPCIRGIYREKMKAK